MSNESEKEKTEKTKFEIHVDGVKYEVLENYLSGRQVKSLAGKDAQYQLFLEEHGNNADKLVGDDESVPMKNGMHFYTVPPATFGNIITWGAF